MSRPLRLGAVSLILPASLALLLAPGCDSAECEDLPRCEGTVAHYCGSDDSNDALMETSTDCASSGQTCAVDESTEQWACVLSEKESCTEPRCSADGSRIEVCAVGFYAIGQECTGMPCEVDAVVGPRCP